MIQAAKIIGTGLATTGLIGAGVGIRPRLLPHKVKSPQKRHAIMGTSGIGIGMAGATGVAMSFGLFAIFGFGFLTAFSFMAEGGGGGGTNTVDPMLPMLVDMLHDVNTNRRNMMHQFRESPNMAQNVFQLLNSNHNLFAANYPISLIDYENIQNITQRIIVQAAELDSYQVMDAATRFESAIAEWDVLASELEKLIHNLDPNFDFGSDTDSEDIQQAAEETAGRASNDSGGGAGSGSR